MLSLTITLCPEQINENILSYIIGNVNFSLYKGENIHGKRWHFPLLNSERHVFLKLYTWDNKWCNGQVLQCFSKQVQNNLFLIAGLSHNWGYNLKA